MRCGSGSCAAAMDKEPCGPWSVLSQCVHDEPSVAARDLNHRWMTSPTRTMTVDQIHREAATDLVITGRLRKLPTTSGSHNTRPSSSVENGAER